MSEQPGNLRDMLSQIQRIQEEIQRTQDALEDMTATEDAGGGLVQATANGKQELVRIVITPEALLDREMLEDLVVAAVNKALRSASQIAAQELNRRTSQSIGGLKLPGLDLEFPPKA